MAKFSRGMDIIHQAADQAAALFKTSTNDLPVKCAAAMACACVSSSSLRCAGNPADLLQFHWDWVERATNEIIRHCDVKDPV